MLNGPGGVVCIVPRTVLDNVLGYSDVGTESNFYRVCYGENGSFFTFLAAKLGDYQQGGKGAYKQDHYNEKYDKGLSYFGRHYFFLRCVQNTRPAAIKITGTITAKNIPHRVVFVNVFV